MSDKIEVYKSIAAITGKLAREGITKDRKNQQQGFQYRGIDDVYAALSPLLAEHNLCILPRIVSKESAERTSAKGGVLFYNLVTAEFDIVSAIDGSKHTVISYGEAFDSGDKSIGKAMSYAYKAMAFMTFAVPTEGDNDPDATTHEISNENKRQETPQLNEAQKKYFPRISDALDIAFGSDIKAKEAKLVELTTWTKNKGKENEEIVKGTPDYRIIKSDKTLEILCHSIEALAKKKVKDETTPSICNECRQEPCICMTGDRDE